jgi:hypothetical protein
MTETAASTRVPVPIRLDRPGGGPLRLAGVPGQRAAERITL